MPIKNMAYSIRLKGVTIVVNIINAHPTRNHPFGVSSNAFDDITSVGVNHRKLTESNRAVLLDIATQAIKKHHASPEMIKRRQDLIQQLNSGIENPCLSLFPQNPSTRKGNFAEIVLAEYLQSTTTAKMPIYRLRYNPNVDQSMKGDDVLLFDLDTNPVRIIVGESKFRGTPSKKAVSDIIDGLVRSNRNGLPASLAFVADRLFDMGKEELGEKVGNCAILFANDKLHIDYVGFLMSDTRVSAYVDTHTTAELHNLVMISLGVSSPDEIVQRTFDGLEGVV
jgi:hypothetical protein